MKPNDLHPDLQALFDEAASLSDPNLKGMGEANRALADNPEFVDSASENGKMLYLNNEDYPETRVAETPADYNVNRNVSSNSESK